MHRSLFNRRLGSSACLLILSLFLLCLPAVTGAQDGPNKNSRNAIAAFIDSIAETTYNLAWPTATYRKYEIVDFKVADSGFDVIVKLSGISAFDNSDLWMKLGFAFRGGDLKNVWVVDDNAILSAPFQTMKELGKLAADLAKQYAKPTGQQGATTAAAGEAGGICLVNETQAALVFSFRWGNGPWQQGKLEASSAELYWWSYQRGGDRSSPPFEIRYDDSFEEGYTEQAYVLVRYAGHLPFTCETAKKYVFTNSGPKIYLQGVN